MDLIHGNDVLAPVRPSAETGRALIGMLVELECPTWLDILRRIAREECRTDAGRRAWAVFLLSIALDDAVTVGRAMTILDSRKWTSPNA